MQVAVLASPDSWYLADLQRAAGARWKIVPATFRQIVGMCGGTHAGQTCGTVNFAEMAAVLVRTMPPGSLEQVVFRMDLLGQIEQQGTRVINPPRAIEAAVDKYLASAKLHAAGLLTPRTVVCQTVEDALEAFHALGGDVVLKPLFGAEGRGITRLQDEALAQRAFSMLVGLGAVLYLQEFIEHEGADLRVLLVGERAWGMRRSNPLDWRTNISRGASGEPFPLTSEHVELARRAAAAVGAPLAGVDLLPARNGGLYVIEVNAVPGWRALSRVTGVDIARNVLEFATSGA